MSLATDDALTLLQCRLTSWQARVREAKVTPRLSHDDLRARLAAHDFAAPRPLAELVDEVAKLLEQGGLHSTHPRYFGLFNAGVRPAGVLADALAALYNPQLGAFWHSPAATEIEQRTLAYLRGRLGLSGSEATAVFTTGGSEANLSGVLAALYRAEPGCGEAGLAAAARRPVFYASEQAHDSFVKIAHATGLGRSALRRVRSDDKQRLDVAELRRAIASDRTAGLAPFLVVATVGTTATGAIDPLRELAALCRDEGLWLHADAAWGGLAVLSDALRPHVAGLELADSVTWDAHKTLPVPMGAGMFFCRWRRYTDAVFAVHTGYVPEAVPGTPELYQQSLQWSRRFIGLKVFLTLAELGAAGVAALVEGQVATADFLRARLVAGGWRLTNDTPLPVLCFTRDGLSPDAVSALVRAVAEEGAAWISEVRTLSGERWLRACVTHHETTPDDAEALVAALERACQRVR